MIKWWSHKLEELAALENDKFKIPRREKSSQLTLIELTN